MKRHPERTRQLKVKKLIIALLVMCLLVPVSCAAPPTPAPTPAPSVPANIIPDLAYIKACAGQYSDDADPEPEGIEILISWYDTKSEMIRFGTVFCENKNVPVSVDIEVHQMGYQVTSEEYIPETCIYKGQAQIDCSICYPKIPFEDMNPIYIPTRENYGFLVKLTVHTPKQGDYSAETIGLSDFGFD